MNRITPAFMVTALATALGTALIALELFLSQFPLAATGVILLGMAGASLSWKQQVGITTLHAVRRLVARQTVVKPLEAPQSSPTSTVRGSATNETSPSHTAPARDTSPTAQTPHPPEGAAKTTVPHIADGPPDIQDLKQVAPKTASSPTPPSTVPSSVAGSTHLSTTRTSGTDSVRTLPSRFADSSEKLRHIGVWAPKRRTPSQHGRIDASVSPDPDSAFRLFAATNGFGAPEVSNVAGRTIALVGSDALFERLSAHFILQRLHPRLSDAELEHARPSTLIVEEDALVLGPWSGTLEPQGFSLLSELLAAQAWIRQNAGLNYVLPAAKSRASIPTLRAEAVVIEESMSTKDAGPPALIEVFMNHMRLKGRP